MKLHSEGVGKHRHHLSDRIPTKAPCAFLLDVTISDVILLFPHNGILIPAMVYANGLCIWAASKIVRDVKKADQDTSHSDTAKLDTIGLPILCHKFRYLSVQLRWQSRLKTMVTVLCYSRCSGLLLTASSNPRWTSATRA